MKQPQTPPDVPFPPTGEQLTRLISHRELFRAEPSGRYLHWDELRRRPAPKGITHEDWWAAIKFVRKSQALSLPLTDTQGRHFTFTLSDTVQRHVHDVDRTAIGRIEVPEDIVNQSTRDRYLVSSLMEEAIRSSQIEGASTTREVAKEMIRTKRRPRDRSEQMILNNFRAMEWVREHKDATLTPDLILALHAVVGDEALDANDGAGRLRRADEAIFVMNAKDERVHTPPPASQLPMRMQLLCRLANGTSKDEPFIHPVVRAILVHFSLAYDHPFVDGNGRTARALFYWSMLNQGYWLTEFLSISRVIHRARAPYDRAFLFSESDESDATYFICHQLGVLCEAIEQLHEYLRRKTAEVRELESSLRKHPDLNHRQLAVIGHALRHPDASITVEGHQYSHGVVYETARTDLIGLVSAGYLESRKVGKKLVFTPAPGLDRKLKK